MSSEPDYDFLARAARELREAPEPGWAEAGQRLISAARAATRRTVPLRAGWRPDPALDARPERAADTIMVSDQVVLSTLRRTLATIPGTRLTGISLDVEEHVCTGLDLHLSAGYGTDLGSAGAEIRAVAQLVLQELLGSPATSYRVDVFFDDVQPA